MQSLNTLVYTEEERAAEKKQAVELVSTLSTTPIERSTWHLELRRTPGRQIDDPHQLLIAFRDSFGELRGFESESEADSANSTEDQTEKVAAAVYNVFCRAAAFPMNRRGEPERPTRVVMTTVGDLIDQQWRSVVSQRLQRLNIQFDLDPNWKPSLQTEADKATASAIDKSNCTTAKQVYLFACHVCSRSLSETLLSRCARCEAVRYCGRECQKTDWTTVHRRVCASLRTDRTQARELPQRPGCYTQAKATNFNWDEYVQQTTLSAVWPMAIALDHSMNSSPMIVNYLKEHDLAMANELCLDAPLLESSGFRTAPKAISTWLDVYRAKGLSVDSPAALLIHRPLTLFHLLTHVAQKQPYTSMNPIKTLVTTPGTYLCVHWVNTTRAHVAVSMFYELLTVLLPGVTIDLFLVGTLLVNCQFSADMLDTNEQSGHKHNRDSQTTSKSVSYTRVFKNEREGSCIRVHIAPVTYSRFPAQQYPADLVILSEMTATNEPLNNLLMQTINKALSAHGCLAILESTALGIRLLTDDIRSIKNEVNPIHQWTPVFETVQMNPFIHPWSKILPSLCLPAFNDAFLQTFTRI
ncbi:hypothetical protein BDF19DRAFT_436915 [Syncephalis fuscata]|nr:hypothetical protein BDF19DRAFT_436915 [Syncephalis fuscata]